MYTKGVLELTKTFDQESAFAAITQEDILITSCKVAFEISHGTLLTKDTNFLSIKELN
jgi:hypothetical protein